MCVGGGGGGCECDCGLVGGGGVGVTSVCTYMSGTLSDACLLSQYTFRYLYLAIPCPLYG